METPSTATATATAPTPGPGPDPSAGIRSSVRSALGVAGLGAAGLAANAATGGEPYYYIIGGALVFLGLSVAAAVRHIFG